MRKIIFIFFIISFIFVFEITSVSATCFHVKYANGSSSYTTNPPSDAVSADIVVDAKCSKSNGKIDFNSRVSCGSIGSFNKKIPEITSWLISLVEIAVPIILAIIGAIDFVKGITSQKEDESRKAQQLFLKRIITAIIIFFVVAFGKLVVNAFSSGDVESGHIIDCIDCFISNDCD